MWGCTREPFNFLWLAYKLDKGIEAQKGWTNQAGSGKKGSIFFYLFCLFLFI
jgi:hypothetical protein